jgi:hypothetical protein
MRASRTASAARPCEALRAAVIAPKLDASTLKEITEVTGLSLAACSRVRADAKVPHQRHWGALLALVG